MLSPNMLSQRTYPHTPSHSVYFKKYSNNCSKIALCLSLLAACKTSSALKFFYLKEKFSKRSFFPGFDGGNPPFFF